MKRSVLGAMLLVSGALFQACSSGGATTEPTSTGGSGPSAGGTTASSSSAGGATETQQTGGRTATGGTGSGGLASGGAASGGASSSGGAAVTGGAASGGATAAGGALGGAGGSGTGRGGTTASGGTTGGATLSGGSVASGGRGGAGTTGGANGSGGVVNTGGSAGTAGKGGSSSGGSSSGGSTGSGGTTGSGPVGTISGPLSTGVIFVDTDGNPVNAHGGGIIQVGDTFYLHGEFFLYDASQSETVNNSFHGFSMYSSKDLATWKNEGIILPQQAAGTELAAGRNGERPHIIKCPATGEFVLYAHAADITYQVDKEVIYATSATVNGKYSFKGALMNASGTKAEHSDMGAFADETGAYVITESGHVYTLASDCHSWLSDKTVAVNGDSGGSESPAVFKANGTYYWIGSYKTGWRANNNFYSTASAMTGPWTYQGFVAPVTNTSTVKPSGSTDSPEEISDQRTWLSQSTWVQPVVGSKGTVFVYWGDHWFGNTDTSNPGKRNDQAGYVFQPIVFSTGTKMLLPTYNTTWKIDLGAGTWSL